MSSIQKRKQWHTIAEFPGGTIESKEKFVPFHRIVYRVVDYHGHKSHAVDTLSEAQSIANRTEDTLPAGTRSMESSK